MKCFTLAALAGAVMLCGCASTDPNVKIAAEESYTPIGTMIARKGPARTEDTSGVDKQKLENDRIMGSATLGQ